MFSPLLFCVEGGAYGAFKGKHVMISHFVDRVKENFHLISRLV